MKSNVTGGAGALYSTPKADSCTLYKHTAKKQNDPDTVINDFMMKLQIKQ